MNKLIRQISLYFLFSLSINIGLQSQDLIQSEYIRTIQKETLTADFGIIAFFDVELYKLLYTTPDVEGKLDTASGLLVVPIQDGSAFPLMVVQHGTVGSKAEVPSNERGGYQLPLIWATYGYIAIAPDLLGLGDARGFHPYVHADSEAWASIDMIRATKQFAAQNDVAYNDQLFITGYSQGGHSAMALHRDLELNHADEFTVTASAPMSGPYSVSKEMVKATLGDEEYFFVAYLANVALSFQMVYKDIFEDDSLESFFKAPYASMIEQYRDEKITLWDLNNMLIDQLVSDYGASIPRNMLQDDVAEKIVSGDPDFPANIALKDNDTYDWAPTAPTRLYYCTADDQVTYRNSIRADSVMNANGAFDLEAIDVNSAADHGGCVSPAISRCILFFGGFQDITSSIEDLSINHRDLYDIYPNPTNDFVVVELDEQLTSQSNHLLLYDLSGNLLKTEEINNSGTERLDLTELRPGIYVLQIKGEKFQFHQLIQISR